MESKHAWIIITNYRCGQSWQAGYENVGKKILPDFAIAFVPFMITGDSLHSKAVFFLSVNPH